MILLLLACADNTVTVKDTDVVPFDIGRIRSALFLETAESDPTTGQGVAMLLMTEADTTCDQFKLQLGGSYFYSLVSQNSFDDDGDGILAVFQWWHREDENAGWTGTYPVFGYSYEDGRDLTRGAWVLPFSDETTWLNQAGGYASIDGRRGDVVRGDIDTAALSASFKAEHCGQQSEGYYY